MHTAQLCSNHARSVRDQSWSGAKHLQALTRKVQHGDFACLIYVIGRTDAQTVQPAAAIDPFYAEQVTIAKAAGVQFFCLTTDIKPTGILPLEWKRL